MHIKIFAGFFMISTLFLSACEDEVAVDQMPPLVKTQKILPSQNNSTGQNYTGTVQDRYSTNLAFQVGGQIASRNVEVGSRVSQGEILFTINPRDVLEQNRQAAAQVSSAKAQLDLAKTNLERFEKLFAEEAVAAATLDQYRANFEAAEAQYRAAVAAESASQNSLEYTHLTADSEGIISSINVEVGQVVAAGQIICTLVQTSELEVAIDVPENRLAEVEIGSEVAVDFWAINGKFTGIVRELSPVADSATRTFNVKIALPNPPQNLQLGMTASVQTFSKNISNGSVEIPISAIFQIDTTPQVWIVKSNRVSKKSIEVISFDEKFAKVRGLNPGAIIVTAGVHKLIDGQSVRVAGESQ